MPSALRTLTALSPSTVIGIFTTIFGWIFAISRPSAIIPSASVVVAFTSPLIGPSTISVISLMTSLKSRPSFAIRDGLVVTPQITPMSFAFLMSSTFAVSMKNLMLFFLPYSYFRKVSGPVVFRRTAPFFCYLQYRYVWFFRQVGLIFIN